MIENVEEFCTKFQGGPFSNSGVLVKSKIPIVDPRSMKKAALCVSHAAQDFLREGRGIEEQMLRISRVKEVNRLAVVVGHVGPATAAQRLVVILSKCDRETGIETGDSRNCPARKQFALDPVGRPGERQIVAIADDKIVRYIARWKAPGLSLD